MTENIRELEVCVGSDISTRSSGGSLTLHLRTPGLGYKFNGEKREAEGWACTEKAGYPHTHIHDHVGCRE